MATAAQGSTPTPAALPEPEQPLVSVQEYLRTSYTPDAEYLDGVLKEKSVVGFPHGNTQVLLGTWFQNHAREWGIRVAVEARTRVRSTRFRLPDLIVVPADVNPESALETAPLIAIEVLSPTDEYAELRARARDLATMGCANVWLVDPQEKTVAVWDGASWQLFAGERLQATGTPACLDLPWLWQEYA